MLRKIQVDELRLGMHVHQLCGAWLDHPFWKTKFLLKDPADLAKLRSSGVKECWIDPGKGLDVGRPGRLESDPPPAPAPAARAEPRPAPAQPTTTREEESARAATLMKDSRKAVESLFSEARLGKTLQAEQCVELVDQVASSVWRNPEAFVSLARLKTHDDYTYMHSVAVCALMISLARQTGLDEAEARQAGMAGLLHDMGKALMPIEILNKPGKLTDHEFTVIRGHPRRGHEMLLEGQGVDEVALDVCLHHHEKTDGSGYPDRLTDAQITKFAKMGAICDVYDAISSNRPYKAGWDPAESIAKMASWAKGHFDEPLFKAFVTSLGIYPTGSLVKLKSGLLAVVIEQNPASLIAPKVRAFFSTRSNMPITPSVIDLWTSGHGDKIVSRESNEEWKFKHLDELWAGAEALRKLGRK
jgi:putative nucleotidyltransferase with HDIG domain